VDRSIVGIVAEALADPSRSRAWPPSDRYFAFSRSFPQGAEQPGEQAL